MYMYMCHYSNTSGARRELKMRTSESHAEKSAAVQPRPNFTRGRTFYAITKLRIAQRATLARFARVASARLIAFTALGAAPHSLFFRRDSAFWRLIVLDEADVPS